MESNKKELGQFYTTRVDYILQDFNIPENTTKIIEPFVGNGDMIKWVKNISTIEMYDIDPKIPGVIIRDTLKNPPDYSESFVITNPPFLARNKSVKKELFELYKTNDLYKCFIKSISNSNCEAGIVIIPAGFFTSSRKSDIKIRDTFMTKYLITKIRYFEETVFDDTSITIVAFSFIKNNKDLKFQNVLWEFFPEKNKKNFYMSKENFWLVGGEILTLNSDCFVSRHVSGRNLKQGEFLSFMTLRALDGGKQHNKISLDYCKDYIYQSKESSRAFATIVIKNKELSEEQQIILCREFNKFINKKREETNSLFLPQFRESKEYARKRISFDMAYGIISYIILELNY